MSLGMAMAALLQHNGRGRSRVCGAYSLYNFWGPFLKKKECKMMDTKNNYESECLCRMKQEITTNYKKKKS